MKQQLIVAALASATLIGIGHSEEPCVSYGKKTEVEFKRPPLTTSGTPVGAQWSGGDPDTGGGDGEPEATEVDWGTPDDPIPGTKSPDGSTVKIKVSHEGYRQGGLHIGNPPEDEEFGSWTQCLELRVCWTVSYKKTIKSKSGHFGASGAFGLFGFEYGWGEGVPEYDLG